MQLDVLGDALPGVEFLMSEDQLLQQNRSKIVKSKNAERKEIVKYDY